MQRACLTVLAHEHRASIKPNNTSMQRLDGPSHCFFAFRDTERTMRENQKRLRTCRMTLISMNVYTMSLLTVVTPGVVTMRRTSGHQTADMQMPARIGEEEQEEEEEGEMLTVRWSG
jgi:hypothetical protein